jgi:hypothetical protein
MHCRDEGRSPILLTERKDHLQFFAERLERFVRHLVVPEHLGSSSEHLHGSASHSLEHAVVEPVLDDIAESVRSKGKVPQAVMRDAICRLCSHRYLTLAELAHLLGRSADTLRGALPRRDGSRGHVRASSSRGPETPTAGVQDETRLILRGTPARCRSASRAILPTGSEALSRDCPSLLARSSPPRVRVQVSLPARPDTIIYMALDLPDTASVDHDDTAVTAPSALEAEATATLLKVAETVPARTPICELADAIRESCGDGPVGGLIEWVHVLALMDLVLGTRSSRHEKPLRASYGRDIEQAPAGLWAVAQSVAQRGRNPVLGARLADAVWVYRRKHEMAKLAFVRYLAAADEMISHTVHWHEAVGYLSRAAELCRSIGDRRDDLHRVATALLARLPDHAGATVEFARLLEREISENDALGTAFNRRVSAQVRSYDEGIRGGEAERAFLDSLMGVEGRSGHRHVRELRRAQLRSLARELRDRQSDSTTSDMLRTQILKQAIALAGELGESEIRTELLERLRTGNQSSLAHMQTFETRFSITQSEIDDSIERLLMACRGEPPWAPLTLLPQALGLWSSCDELGKELDEQKRATPLLAIIHREWLNDDGRSRQTPSDPAMAREAQLVRHYCSKLPFIGVYLGLHVRALRDRRVWTHENLRAQMGAGILFPEDVLAAISPGLEALEEGRDWEALHVLVPQIERVVRALAVSLTVPVSDFKPQTGENLWLPLGSLVSEPSVAKVLDLIHKDFSFNLRAVLCSSFGLNLRNEVAHGLIPRDRSSASGALLAVLILSALARLRHSPAPENRGV